MAFVTVGFWTSIVCIRVSTTFKNTASLFLAKNPPSNLQTVQATPFLGTPPSISVFHELPFPLKFGFFGERPKYQNFSSLTPSYLLKVTKFLVKIFQFEFLVMTMKNIFV